MLLVKGCRGPCVVLPGPSLEGWLPWLLGIHPEAIICCQAHLAISAAEPPSKVMPSGRTADIPRTDGYSSIKAQPPPSRQLRRPTLVPKRFPGLAQAVNSCSTRSSTLSPAPTGPSCFIPFSPVGITTKSSASLGMDITFYQNFIHQASTSPYLLLQAPTCEVFILFHIISTGSQVHVAFQFLPSSSPLLARCCCCCC